MLYEVFLGYARADNDEGWVAAFRDGLCSVYRKLTGDELPLFHDVEEITTASIWERRIRVALDQSDALIAIVSPSYIRSEWCFREWQAFEEKEQRLRAHGLLADDQGIIFPILLYPFERGRFDEREAAFAVRVANRQWLDASSRLEGTPLRRDQLRAFTENLIDNLTALRANVRSSSRARAVVTDMPPGPTIIDQQAGLEWFGSLSPTEMTFDEARDYVEGLPLFGGIAWRLPTKAELESLIDREALDPEPSASPVPLREPFNSQRFGYLFSGEIVAGYGADSPYVMNVRNGHIFNGQGNCAYVRAVRHWS